MNRFNPVTKRVSVSGAISKISEAPTGNLSIATLIENHGAAALHLIFNDAGTAPDPDDYVTVLPGCAIEVQPVSDIWGYTPSGATCDVVIARGVRHVGQVDSSADPSEAAATDQLVVVRKQKEILNAIDLKLGVLLAYCSLGFQEELRSSDALDV